MKTRRATPLLCTALAAALLLAACGVDESTTSPVLGGEQPLPIADDRGRNLTDTTVTALRLDTSLTYEAAEDRVRAYFAVRDQDGSSLLDYREPGGTPGFDITGRNFAVTLFPGSSSSRPLNPQEFLVGTQFRDSKVIALVIDVSGSMSAEVAPGQTRLDLAKEVAKNFVDSILGAPDSRDLMALIEFDTGASIRSPLTGDAARLKGIIDGLEPKGATNFGAAFTAAVQAVGVQPGKRAVVFLTDGVDTVDGSPTGVVGDWPAWEGKATSLRWQALQKLVALDVVTFAIGFGEAAAGAAADLLAYAEHTGGEFFPAETADDLVDAFDPAQPESVPARIEELEGITSPFVSFPNDYSTTRGPIGAEVRVSFENANGVLSAKTLGTYTVSEN